MKTSNQPNISFTSLVVALALFITFVPLSAQQTNLDEQHNVNSRKNVEKELNNTRITVDFDGQSLQSIVSWLQNRKVSFPIIIGSSVDPDLNITKTLQKPVSIKRFLRFTLMQYGLTARYESGSLRIVKQGQREDLTRRLYDVRDIMTKVKDHEGPELMLTDPDTGKSSDSKTSGCVIACTLGFGNGNKNDHPLGNKEVLKQTIQNSTGGGKTWKDRGGMNITNGMLIVHQTPSVQRKIRRIIHRLRQF